MKTAAGVVLVAGALLLAGPAYPQAFPNTPPPPPPPQWTPPPPPPPPPSWQQPQPVFVRPPPPPDDKPTFTIRASGGVGFVGAGLWCGYVVGVFVVYTCTAGYAAAFPDVNLDVDIWLQRGLGVTLGTNVMWGTYTPFFSNSSLATTYSTIWEPHFDVLLAPESSQQVRGRVRLGFGLYVANVNNGTPPVGVQPYNFNGVGGAFRLGFGASFLPKSKVGIGMDAIFEAGWIGSYYVSTVQLLVGPEFNFF